MAPFGVIPFVIIICHTHSILHTSSYKQSNIVIFVSKSNGAHVNNAIINIIVITLYNALLDNNNASVNNVKLPYFLLFCIVNGNGKEKYTEIFIFIPFSNIFFHQNKLPLYNFKTCLLLTL